MNRAEHVQTLDEYQYPFTSCPNCGAYPSPESVKTGLVELGLLTEEECSTES